MSLGPQLQLFLRDLPADIASVEPADRVMHAYDATNEFHIPSAVVRPRNEDELGLVIRAANAHRVPVFPRAAATGFTGGSLPLHEGVALDLLALNRLLDLDEKSMLVRVQPGIVTSHLQDEVAKVGLYYPPDPASLKTCTIGGNVAENAGGPHCLKYGLTRDYVLAIRGFTGDGRLFETGKGILKNRAGYDLRHLLIGSEGTLAVFSELLLRLIPQPEASLLFSAFFADYEAATAMVNTLLHNGVSPASIEFMDQAALQAVERHAGLGLPLHYAALLLIEVDGRSDEIPQVRDRVERCLQGVAAEVRYAIDPAEQEALWEVRRQASPAMRAYGNKKANEDVVFPRGRIPEAMRGLRRIADEYRIKIINFGHIGDGNIHVNIMYDADDADECRRVQDGIKAVFDLANELDGAVSGEHGIGIAKKRFLPKNIDRTSYELMRSLKATFDPNNILNPGKMLY